MRIALAFFIVPIAILAAGAAAAQIPRVWDDVALQSMELPLASPARSPRHVSSDYYYRMQVRPIYKSYPIYAPGSEPAGYLEWLQQQEPEIAFSSESLKTEDDWIKAGELVFESPIGFGASFNLTQVRDTAWHQQLGVPVAADGTFPFARYVIRKKGQVEVGTGSCAMCHTRVLAGGTVVKGAQGNFPVDRAIGFNLRAQAALVPDKAKFLEDIRSGQRIFFGVPWQRPDPIARIDTMSLEDIAAAHDAIPPGVTTRVNLSLFSPAQIPDLIGVCEMRHLDHTGVVQQRSTADLMRYVALVQGANSFDHFGDFALIDQLPDPERLQRYSDEQLFALASFLCALERPVNPNPSDAVTRRGQAVFQSEGCAQCHTPPRYTNNKLSAADGFQVPPEHRDKYDVVDTAVGTDPALTLQTRKGTGYYKVPSLRGVWYRSPLEHNGSVLKLEDWFDPRRREPGYAPTGFRGYGVESRAVRGHPFGLSLSEEDRRSLIAFLRTL